MKSPKFLENILNNLPLALLIGALLLFIPRFVFDTETESLFSLAIQAGLELSGIYIVIVSLYRKNKVARQKATDKRN